jgi:uncharacterized protein (TIGR02646 family)
MRRLIRGPLPPRVKNYLTRKRLQVSQGTPAQLAWKRARRTKSMRVVEEELRRMAGGRQRCMFCEDSYGADIEHFWPMARYPKRAFRWTNLFLACTACNRQKGVQFDFDANRQPLLIDPTREDPWLYLFYEPRTGLLTARFDPQTGAPSDKGAYTTNPSVLPLNIEAISEGRQRIHRNLRRAVHHFLQSDCSEVAVGELEAALRDNSDYGLLVWFLSREGMNDQPFVFLRQHHPDLWERLQALLV